MTAQPETRERILVVDDEPVVLHACARALARHNFAVYPAGSGTEALDLLRPDAFDLLLTDIKMPDMDGLELLRRAREIDPDLTTMVLTGHGTIETAVASIRLGVSGYVVKPFTLQELGAAVEEALAKRRLAQENARLHAALEARQLAEEERIRAAREEAARIEAERLLGLQAAFLATTSHDLRSPLTAVLGYAELLRRDMLGRTPASLEQRLSRVDALEATVHTVMGQLDELTDLAHLRAGQRLRLSRRRTDLAELVRRVAAEQQELTGRHRIRVQAEGETVVGFWDVRRLERVLINLLSNAIKYSPSGGDVVVVASGERDAVGAWAVVSVADRGIGIPAGDLPRLFEPFFRARNTEGTTTGLGLGLAGARQIVEQHGGTIAVTSQEGGGSTFTLRLPTGMGEPGSASEQAER